MVVDRPVFKLSVLLSSDLDSLNKAVRQLTDRNDGFVATYITSPMTDAGIKNIFINFAKKEKNMEALTIHPQNNEQLEAIKSVLKALKIPFYKSHYNPEFVKKIQESEKHEEGAVILKCEEDISNYLKNPETDVQD